MKTVIEMAREAGIRKAFTCSKPDECPDDDDCCHKRKPDGYWVKDEQLERFAALVREDEREKLQSTYEQMKFDAKMEAEREKQQDHSEQDLNMVQPVACKRCNGTGIVPDGTIDCIDGYELETVIECVKDCPDCTKPTTPPTAALAARQMRDACISILHNLDMGSAYQLSLGQRMRLREAMEALPIQGEEKPLTEKKESRPDYMVDAPVMHPFKSGGRYDF